MKRAYVLLAMLILAIGLVVFRSHLGFLLNPVVQRMTGGKTIADRLDEFGEDARGRMGSAFEKAGVAYPPAAVTFLAIKAERKLYVYAGPSAEALRQVQSYPVLGQSGELGPKLREGDRQVPEGVYRIDGLNPNSRFHVSLRVNYPNEFDREKAAEEGRDQPGSDIYVHGQTASIGCLAMGNPVAEELFTLAADVGVEHINLIISPVDFRKDGVREALPEGPPWLPALYKKIEAALHSLE